MSRLMSVAFTEQAVRERRKTVTRRKGWLFLKPGDHLTLCRKVMGRKPGEPLIRIAEVEVIDVRREPLQFVHYIGELTKEGFPELEPTRILDGTGIFVKRFFAPQGIGRFDIVMCIEWRYFDTVGALL